MRRELAIGTRPRQARGWRTQAILLSVAFLWLAAGLAVLWLHYRDLGPRTYRAGSGLVLLLLGLLQARLVWSAHRRGMIQALALHRRPLFWRWLLVGPVACFLGVLSLGPDPGAAYVLLASLAGWHTVALAPLAMGPGLVGRLALAAQSRPARAAGWAGFGALISLAVAEGVVQLYAAASGDRLAATYVVRTRTLPPGSQFQGRLVNAMGYWDDSFQTSPRPGIVRIAALGDEAILSGSAETNYLDVVEHRVPGIEIYNFGIPHAGPREYAAQVAQEVSDYRPELVLLFVSIEDDITDELPAPGMFDWRGLGLYQLGARSFVPRGAAVALDAPAEASNREAFLRSAANALRVCRTPIDGAMQDRWTQTFAYLDEIVRGCRQRNMAAVLVLVPSACQVSPTLCESLRRQAGCEPGEIDLELPQRRLAAYADENAVPLIDLLPHLRASPVCPYRRNESRWNDQGDRIAADVLGQWLAGRFGTLVAATKTAAVP